MWEVEVCVISEMDVTSPFGYSTLSPPDWSELELRKNNSGFKTLEQNLRGSSGLLYYNVSKRVVSAPLQKVPDMLSSVSKSGIHKGVILVLVYPRSKLQSHSHSMITVIGWVCLRWRYSCGS